METDQIKLWFLNRYIHDDNARIFAERVLGLVDPETLTTDQKKKINYYLKNKYAWLDFHIEQITKKRWKIIPNSAPAGWAYGVIEIIKDEVRYISYPDYDLFS